MKFFIYVLILFIPNFLWADYLESYKKLEKKYNFDRESYTFIVKNISEKNSAPIIRNQNKLFNPASVAKIITTYIALKELGPNFKWRSDFLYTGEIIGDTLHGDIIFKGRGDATFNTEDLERLIRGVHRDGIINIEGNLILDKSYFLPVDQIKDFDEDPLRAYNALPNSIVIQSNTTNFKFSEKGGKIKIEVTPELKKLEVKNKLQLTNSRCASWKSKLDYSRKHHKSKSTIIFSGEFSKKCFEKEIDLSVLDDSQYFYEIFNNLWLSNGGNFNGSVKTKNINELDARLLKSHFSKSLSEIIRDINKFSLNLMARNLMLTVLAESKEYPINESSINIYVKSWLVKNKINSKGIIFENGAGLSRITQISAKQLLHVMEKIYNDPMMPEVISSFPIIGTDGTLKKRMRHSSARGNGHFKTGSLNNVNAIAGYFLNKDKGMKIFIFMMNDLKANQSESFQQDLIDLAYSY